MGGSSFDRLRTSGYCSIRTLLDLSPSELAAQLQELGQPAYRARQVLRWAYAGVTSFAEMTDLPAGLRARLEAHLAYSSLAPVRQLSSADGLTRKVLFRLGDGRLVEAVLMRYSQRGGGQRATICVSSQAGCAYGCQFCATGQQGYGRSLTAGEMVEQVLYFLREPEAAETSGPGPEAGLARKPSNVVFMGMGEPFANYEQVRRAILAFNASWGLGLAARHITVSTVGLVPQIKRFAQEPWQVGLAISLHAPNDRLRRALMPVNRKYPLAALIAACRDYVAHTSRRVSFEYVLLAEVNDGEEQARELAELLSGLLCHVNLIPVNPTAASQFRRPAPERVEAFARALRRRHIPVTVRDTRGVEIQAGCGQLRAREPARAPTTSGALR
ncbi:MAG: 23S rRNA (adenine(2503)-C(2))-methyltransferase RlmN [Chloroflexi bacterium]|nr:23S rRNA (adenine(2503)-C(2))-methyltransferase RlmN [Chloroflexota bacterium]